MSAPKMFVTLGVIRDDGRREIVETSDDQDLAHALSAMFTLKGLLTKMETQAEARDNVN